jgi:hypothetical protein
MGVLGYVVENIVGGEGGERREASGSTGDRRSFHVGVASGVPGDSEVGPHPGGHGLG